MSHRPRSRYRRVMFLRLSCARRPVAVAIGAGCSAGRVSPVQYSVPPSLPPAPCRASEANGSDGAGQHQEPARCSTTGASSTRRHRAHRKGSKRPPMAIRERSGAVLSDCSGECGAVAPRARCPPGLRHRTAPRCIRPRGPARHSAAFNLRVVSLSDGKSGYRRLGRFASLSSTSPCAQPLRRYGWATR